MISAVITAAGSSERFGGDKLLALLAGKPVLIRTLMQFRKSNKIDEIVVAVKRKDMESYKKIIRKAGLKVKMVKGGPERVISAYNVAKAAKGDIVITHDGNRPLTPVWLIDKLIEETIKYGAAMTAIPPTATIKYAEDFIIKESLSRSKTWIAQTPQGFKRALILSAYEKAIKEKFFVKTDDSELVTRLGEKVRIVPGHPENIKITFLSDLIIAEKLFKND